MPHAASWQLLLTCPCCLLAGDEGLYQESLPAFDIMGKKSLLLGAVGAGARMKLVVNMVMGSMMGEPPGVIACVPLRRLSWHALMPCLCAQGVHQPFGQQQHGAAVSGTGPAACRPPLLACARTLRRHGRAAGPVPVRLV